MASIREEEGKGLQRRKNSLYEKTLTGKKRERRQEKKHRVPVST